LVIKARRSGYEHTLLRAYIPLTGNPVKLDLYDFSMVECPDIPTLEKALVDLLAA